jgi:hypothetical protein
MVEFDVFGDRAYVEVEPAYITLHSVVLHVPEDETQRTSGLHSSTIRPRCLPIFLRLA